MGSEGKGESRMKSNFSFGQRSRWCSHVLRWGAIKVEEVQLEIDYEFHLEYSFIPEAFIIDGDKVGVYEIRPVGP